MANNNSETKFSNLKAYFIIILFLIIFYKLYQFGQKHSYSSDEDSIDIYEYPQHTDD